MTIIRLTEKQYKERVKKERPISTRLVLCRKCGIPKTTLGRCENCEIDKILRKRRCKQ